MTSNFLHIRSSYADAEPALTEWVGNALDADELAVAAEDNGWTTLSMDLDYVETDEWLKLAAKMDLFYESYSTSLRMGEIVVCRERRLVRRLLIDAENPDQDIDLGQLPSETSAPLASWGDIWGYVDDAKCVRDI